MTAQHQLFGVYIPGRSWLHRLPVAAKFALMGALSVVPLTVRDLPVSVALLALTGLFLATTRLPWRRCYVLPPMIWVMAGLLLAYQALWGTCAVGGMLVANLVLCLYAARILTLTTPAPVLLDALVVLARPVRLVGGSPERVGLAAALMIRSIPFLFGSLSEVRDAARARGLERNYWARLVPVVVGAVAYAKATGEALAARGLGEEEWDEGEDGG